MSLIPAFRIGLWNAWLLLLPLYLIPTVATPSKKEPFRRTGSRARPDSREGVVFVFSKVALGLTMVYSIFLPLKTGTTWCYVGLPLGLLGIAMYVVVSINIVRTPDGRPFTRGLYRYSRHPMYVFSILTFVGAGIAAASWLFLLLSVLFVVTHFVNAVYEERRCLEAYGRAYEEYLATTPRWLGLPRRQAGPR